MFETFGSIGPTVPGFWAGSSYQNFLKMNSPGYCRPALYRILVDLRQPARLTVIIGLQPTACLPGTLPLISAPAHPGLGAGR